MVSLDETDVKFYTIFQSSTQLMSQEINMTENKLDIAVGFNKGTDPFHIPSEDLVKIEIAHLKVQNYEQIEEVSLKLGRCGDHFDWNSKNQVAKTLKSEATCVIDKEALNLQGGS